MSRSFFVATLGVASLSLSAGCGLFEKSAHNRTSEAQRAATSKGSSSDTGSQDTASQDSEPQDTASQDTAAPPPIALAGTWTIQVTYQTACAVGGGVVTAEYADQFELSINGDNNDLGVVVLDYEDYMLVGAGDNTALQMVGAFPFKDTNGDVPPAQEITASFVGEVSASGDAVEGDLSGGFVTPSGASCTVECGSFQLTR